MLRLRTTERSAFFVAVPLMLLASLVLVWVVPNFSVISRETITALVSAGAVYTFIAYWLRTRKNWRGLRYTTPIVLIGIITLGIVAANALAPIAFVLYFPAILISSIRSGRNISVATAAFATFGYAIATVLNPTSPNPVYDVLFVGANLITVSALSGAIIDEERSLRQNEKNRRERELSALRRLADAFVNTPDLQATLDAAQNFAAQILETEGVAVILEDGGEYVVRKSLGMLARYQGQRLAIDEHSIATTAMARGQAISVGDMQAENGYSLGLGEKEHNVRAALAVPMIRDKKTRGAFLAYSLSAREFSLDEIHLLSLIASQTLVAIERREAEYALRDSEQRFRALIEKSSDGVRLVGADGRILYTSPACTRIFGYAPDETINLNAFDLVHPDDLQTVTTEFTQILHKPGDSVISHYRNRHKDGSWRWIEAIATNMLIDPGVRAIVVNYRDVSERISAEARVHIEAARAAALVRVAARLSAQLELTKVLSAVCEETARALSVSLATVTLYDKERDSLYFAGGFGLTPQFREPLQPRSESVFEELKQTGPLVVIEDVQSIQNLPNANLYTALNIRSTVSLSMMRDNELIGRLNIGTFGESRHFTDDELALLKGLSDQAALAIANAQLLEDARRRLERLQGLRTIDMAISASLDVRVTLNILLNQVTSQLHVDAADVLLLNPHTQRLEYVEGRGLRAAAHQRSQSLGEGLAGTVALERKVISINSSESLDEQARKNLGELNGFIAYYGVPLVAKAEVKGVLEIFNRTPLHPDREWTDYLEALAGQAAIAIENIELFENLQRSNRELFQAYDATIEGWSRALELRDRETEGHTLRVAEMSVRLARALGMSEDEQAHIRRGALLHDIGKMAVPDSILYKPTTLTTQELEIMHQHPIHAYDLLARIPYLRPALDIPYCHHEKWDGTGYPRGLKGDRIPLSARVFAIADVWDALLSERPYRKAWDREHVVEYMASLAGKHFDPQLIEKFLSLQA